MRKLHALVMTALMACSLVVVAATQALACSCVPPQPDRKAVKEAAAVFTGTVVDVEDGVNIGMDKVTWTFAVDTVYKGEVAPTQEIESHTQSAACGLVFKEQKRYVVFAHEGSPTGSKGDGLATNSCMNTREFDEGKNLKLEPVRAFATDPDIPPDEVQTQTPLWQLVLAAIAFVAVVLGVLAVFRRS